MTHRAASYLHPLQPSNGWKEQPFVGEFPPQFDFTSPALQQQYATSTSPTSSSSSVLSSPAEDHEYKHNVLPYQIDEQQHRVALVDGNYPFTFQYPSAMLNQQNQFLPAASHQPFFIPPPSQSAPLIRSVYQPHGHPHATFSSSPSLYPSLLAPAVGAVPLIQPPPPPAWVTQPNALSQTTLPSNGYKKRRRPTAGRSKAGRAARGVTQDLGATVAADQTVKPVPKRQRRIHEDENTPPIASLATDVGTPHSTLSETHGGFEGGPPVNMQSIAGFSTLVTSPDPAGHPGSNAANPARNYANPRTHVPALAQLAQPPTLGPIEVPTEAPTSYRCRLGNCEALIPTSYEKNKAQRHVWEHYPSACRSEKRVLTCNWWLDGEHRTCGAEVQIITLGRHIAKVHGPRMEWMCPICDKRGVRKDAISAHMRRRHEVVATPKRKAIQKLEKPKELESQESQALRRDSSAPPLEIVAPSVLESDTLSWSDHTPRHPTPMNNPAACMHLHDDPVDIESHRPQPTSIDPRLLLMPGSFKHLPNERQLCENSNVNWEEVSIAMQLLLSIMSRSIYSLGIIAKDVVSVACDRLQSVQRSVALQRVMATSHGLNVWMAVYVADITRYGSHRDPAVYESCLWLRLQLNVAA
ncbi:hypothetical protein WOLCODRAFT_146529 [Wolfiporia cocos MD-104 SS10]|uniref:C2H2-type domain-containing protein n=1 Tax=Wolfiporia cocos (strain MD-104) TaxID=742152 RepID=A0A2H3JEC6_WOLCO|nr:hypothetical protein WOLCODRAFT_146529 [Wolfiporia cocos MD-104 SS10]